MDTKEDNLIMLEMHNQFILDNGTPICNTLLFIDFGCLRLSYAPQDTFAGLYKHPVYDQVTTDIVAKIVSIQTFI